MLGQATVDVLLDDILLNIFDFYRGDDEYSTIEMWKLLVHVYRRWRSIIFASPGVCVWYSNVTPEHGYASYWISGHHCPLSYVIHLKRERGT